MEPLTDGQFIMHWARAGLKTLCGPGLDPLACTGAGEFNIAGIMTLVGDAVYKQEISL